MITEENGVFHIRTETYSYLFKIDTYGLAEHLDVYKRQGQDDLPLQEHIPAFQPQNGLAPREEPQNPHRAHRLTQNRGNGRPGHAHVKDENENGVEDNVDHRADDGDVYKRQRHG